MMDALLLEAGYADPVLGAQGSFRAIMDALARPGTLQSLVLPRPSPPLEAGLAAVLLTLADPDTPVWLDADLCATPGLEAWLAFHCAAPTTSASHLAQFAIASRADRLPPLADFAAGTDAYPDRSTTIALAVPALTGGRPLVLRGPGIDGDVRIAPTGLPDDFVGQWELNRAGFPRGVDLLLVCGDALIGLPRATRIALGD